MRNKNTFRLRIILFITILLIIAYTIILISFPNISNSNLVKNVFPFLSIIFSGFVIYSLYLQAYSLDEDYKWKRNHATFEYLREVRLEYVKNYDFIKQKTSSVSKEERLNVLLDTEVRKNAKKILSTFEHIAVGVKRDIFDIDIISDKSGSYIIGAYHNFFKNYIDHIREKDKTKKGYTFAYDNFIFLVNRLEKLRTEKIKKNEIQNKRN